MFAVLMAFLAAQRLLELVLAERNRRWAIEQGGKEDGRGHYPLIVGLHVFFYLSLVLEYAYLSRGWNFLWPLWLGIFLLAQALRVWAILSLGRRWNTRIIVIPGLKPVVRGPYRYIRHPNYVAIVLELLVIPMMCGAYWTAALFSALNTLVLRIRVREEERALERAAGGGIERTPRFLPSLRARG
jgi:methyltransferase